MDGTALVFTLQATEGDDLDEIYVAEVELDATNHDFTNKTSTPTVCGGLDGGTFNESNRQYRYWYCVRPRTQDYPSDEFDPSQYIYSSDKFNNESFGYAYAYGEGQFYKKTNHASRGTCGMFFIDESGDEDEQSLEDLIASLEQDVLECVQKGVIIGEPSGQKNIVNRTQFNFSSVFVNSKAFILLSGYDTSNIPDDSDALSTLAIVLIIVSVIICLIVLVVVFLLVLRKKRREQTIKDEKSINQ